MRNNIYNKVAAESKAIAFTIHLLLFTLITSCSQEAVIAPQDTPDALAMMNPDTPVGISAQVESVKGQATTRAIWVELPDYAWNEAHQESDYITAVVLAPGAVNMNNFVAGNSQYGYVTLQNLGEKFPFYLKDFNLAEGNDRCVTRWTTLSMYVKDGPYYQSLLGMARLTANATTGQPELNYTLHQTGTKLTVKLVDTEGNPIIIDDAITVKANVQGSIPQYIYTDGTTNSHVINKLQSIKTLEEDKALDADNFHMVSIPGQGGEVYLKQLVSASGFSSENGNKVSAVVAATPTHDGADYAPLENSGLTDADVLTITVNTDPDGDGPQTTGTYKLKLSDVKLSETENLTALKSGEHYILTVTLKHNTLVSATATVAGWNEVSADVTLQGNDPSRMPPYEYDANTNTYTIWQEEGIEACLQDKEANNRTDATVMYEGMTIDATLAELAIVSGAETVQEAIDNAIDNGKTTFIIMGDLTDNLCYYIKNCNAAPGTINLFLADATSIGESAFAFCSALKSVNSPKVTSIGATAFSECSALKSVNSPKATSIGIGAFGACRTLASVNLPKATWIDNGVFAQCYALTDLNLPAATSIRYQAFMHCENLKSLTFGSVIGEVGQSSFMNVSTWNCALTLAEGQQHMTEGIDETPGTPDGTPVVAAAEDAASAARTWAGYTWKSITIK